MQELNRVVNGVATAGADSFRISEHTAFKNYDLVTMTLGHSGVVEYSGQRVGHSVERSEGCSLRAYVSYFLAPRGAQGNRRRLHVG